MQHELPSTELSLGRVFAKMEEATRDLQIEDYSVSQNTLDNVSAHLLCRDLTVTRTTSAQCLGWIVLRT